METPNETMERLQSAINDIEKVLENVNKAAEQSQDVKDGKCTVEDEKHEPGFILFNQIAKSVLETLREPQMMNAFISLGNKLGSEVSCMLVNIIAISCATSAHNAVCFYDGLLKDELTKSFNMCIKNLNECRADLTAYKSVLEVFRKRLDAIEEPTKTAQAIKNAGVPIQETKV